MPSHHQPPPPIRTSTHDSQKSQMSGELSPGSDILSPTSTSTRGGASESFFSAIASKVRGRSRSRSRNRSVRERSKSPIMLPPEQLPPASNAQPMSPTYASTRPQQPRHASHASQGSVSSMTAKPTRPSLQGPSRRSTGSSDMWRGRHSNSWLFNDFSVTDTAREILHFRRKE